MTGLYIVWPYKPKIMGTHDTITMRHAKRLYNEAIRNEPPTDVPRWIVAARNKRRAMNKVKAECGVRAQVALLATEIPRPLECPAESTDA